MHDGVCDADDDYDDCDDDDFEDDYEYDQPTFFAEGTEILHDIIKDIFAHDGILG